MSEPSETSPPSSQRSRTPIVRMELTVRTALIAVVTIAACWLFLQLWQVLLVIVVALMLVGMLSGVVERLERRGWRRVNAVLLVFFLLFLLGIAFFALTLPTLVGQLSDVLEHFPKSQEKLARALDGSALGRQLARSVRAVNPDEVAKRAQELGMLYGPWIVEVAAAAATSFFLALYIMLDRDRMRGAVFAVVPRAYHLRLSRVLVNLETIVGGYMRGQVITSLLMTVVTFVVLTVARVPNALALSLFAGVTDVLPYIGALLACGPACLAALSQGTTVAIVVLVVLGIYQEIESRLIVPRVYGKVLRLPAAWVMIALLVGGKLLGVLGALLALPIAAGIRMIIAELRVELPGEELDDAALRVRDAAAEAEFAARAAGHGAVEAAAIATAIAEERLESDAARKGGDSDEAASEPITSGVA